MSSPLIDVVIPVRDLDKYLEQSINSVLEQESVSCNVIVVDAGSLNPIKLPTNIAQDSRVQIVRSESPLTAGGARNLGLTYTRNTFIGFLDGDDIWPSGRCKAMLLELENEESLLVLGRIENFHSDLLSKKLALGENGKPAFSAGGILFKRELLDQIGFFNHQLTVGEFIDWFQRIVTAEIPYKIIDALALRRRVHVESTSAKIINDRLDYLKVVRTWMQQKD
jgi:glycosyltransferase involved in cell wall biosynthesis